MVGRCSVCKAVNDGKFLVPCLRCVRVGWPPNHRGSRQTILSGLYCKFCIDGHKTEHLMEALSGGDEDEAVPF